MSARADFTAHVSQRAQSLCVPMTLIGLGAAVLTAAAGPAGAADCPPFPADAYVGAVSHARVIDYVDRQFAGDWSRYIQLQTD